MFKLRVFEGHFEGYGDTPIHLIEEIEVIGSSLDDARTRAKRIQREGDACNARRVCIWEDDHAIEEVNPWTERKTR
jgi:myosin-crossreactive antigen